MEANLIYLLNYDIIITIFRLSTLEVVNVETAPVIPSRFARWASFVFWWGVTLLTLIVLDDLTVGPAFWLLALVSPILSTIVAFCVSFVFQLWLIYSVTSGQPSRRATRFINRLLPTHKSSRVVACEQSIRRRVVSSLSAIVVTLLIGGVLPVVFLYREGRMRASALRRLALVTTALYALEFALIHGGYGLGAVVRWLV